jgi:hypothetical protein
MPVGSVIHRPKIRLLLSVVGVLVIGLAALITIHFPYDTDAAPSEVEVKKAIEFYRHAYEASRKDNPTSATTLYVKIEEGSGPGEKKEIHDFAGRYGLSGKKALEIGAGSGQLQDVVSDYTALNTVKAPQRYALSG